MREIVIMMMGRQLSLVLFLLIAGKGKGESPPNVLWFVIDDMSAHFSCYGEKSIETPAVDRLANETQLIGGSRADAEEQGELAPEPEAMKGVLHVAVAQEDL